MGVIGRLSAALPQALAVPAVAGRLALWGRRIVGEALAQAHRTAAARPSLAALLAAGDDSLADIGRMFTRMTEAHADLLPRALGGRLDVDLSV